MKLLKFIKKQKSETINSINTLKQNPLDSLGQIIPVLLTLTSFIGLITAYIIFIVKGGYSHQAELLKANGISGLEEAFTSGTVSLIVKGAVPIIIGMLSLCEFIVVLIKFFTAEHKILKIFAIIFLSISITATISILILLIMDTNEIAIDFISRKTAHIIILTALISSSALLILLLFSQTRWMIGHTALSLLISFIISPLILFLLENIILIAISAVLVLIILGIVKFIISFADDASDNTSQPKRKKPVIKKEKPMPQKNQNKNTPIIIEKNYSDEDVFFRDKGGLGFMTPQGVNGTCIFVKRHNFTGNKHEYVCDAYEYDHGKYIIKTKSGRTVKV